MLQRSIIIHAGNPARALIEHQTVLAQSVGLLGPCSFVGCDEFSDARCRWKNLCNSKGGCDELYCDKHGYYPNGWKSVPVSCTDCIKTYKADKARKLGLFSGGIIMLAIIIIVITLACTIWRPGFGDSDAYVPATYAVNESTVDDDIIDRQVYSENLGLDMFDLVNKVRTSGDLPVNSLTWNSNWSNIVFKVAFDYSNKAFDIPSATYLSAKYTEMD